MIKDITIGQFFPGNSFVHKLDARTKILFTLVFLVFTFVCKNFRALALVAVVGLSGLAWLSRRYCPVLIGKWK